MTPSTVPSTLDLYSALANELQGEVMIPILNNRYDVCICFLDGNVGFKSTVAEYSTQPSSSIPWNVRLEYFNEDVAFDTFTETDALPFIIFIAYSIINTVVGAVFKPD